MDVLVAEMSSQQFPTEKRRVADDVIGRRPFGLAGMFPVRQVENRIHQPDRLDHIAGVGHDPEVQPVAARDHLLGQHAGDEGVIRRRNGAKRVRFRP